MSISIKLQRGFSLIEVLITLLIVAIGLMGTATMQLTGLNSNQSAYLRSQASILVYDMADRMRANAASAIAGDYDGFKFKASKSELEGLVSGNCTATAGGCSGDGQSATDKYEWAQNIMGAGSESALLPGAIGEISMDENGFSTVSISWQELDWDGNSDLRNTSDKSFSIKFLVE
ncbi:type IV pilus modification protein PilV [Gammaproteobacteria bacterium 42_54_T18]|nr:type IV pilus modification protein PilV [Gammaproteobacteria bacterium 42_54_T18]